MNQFSDRYKKLDSIDLLRILDNALDYQPLALQAAREELETRNLSFEELNEANSVLAAEKSMKEKSIERSKEIRSIIIKSVINPIQTERGSSATSIILIALAFVLHSVYVVYHKLFELKYFVTDEYSELDLYSIFYFLPIIIVPIATFLFWYRKKSGWTLLIIYLTFSSINTFVLLILVSQLADPYPAPIIDFVFPLIFFLGLIWVIVRENIRKEYGVESKYLYQTFIFTSVATILLVSYWTLF